MKVATHSLCCYFQVSTDDIKQPIGWVSQLKDRAQLGSNSSIPGFDTPWVKLYTTLANINFFLEKSS